MKRLLAIPFFLIALQCQAASWYVDNAATGTNGGTSWTDAWIELNEIEWTRIGPGDTVFVSGGTTSKVYTTALTATTLSSGGTVSSPITVAVGQVSPHNGVVIHSNVINLAANVCTNIVINGAKDLEYSTNNIYVNNLWTITNNIGWKVCGNLIVSAYGGGELGKIVLSGYTGVRLLWVEVSMGDTNPPSANYNCIAIVPADVATWGENEIGYCYIHDAQQDNIHLTNWERGKYGGIKIHHCLNVNVGDDCLEGDSGIDIAYCIMGGTNLYYYYNSQAHPDVIQTSGSHNRFFNNKLTTLENGGIYCGPKLADWYTGHLMAYGNLIEAGSAQSAERPADENGDGIVFTLKDYAESNDFVLYRVTNMIFLNNTIALLDGDDSIVDGLKLANFVDESTPGTNELDYANCTNLYILNNIVYRCNYNQTGQQNISGHRHTNMIIEANTIDNNYGGSANLWLVSNLVNAASFNTAWGRVSNDNNHVIFIETNAPGVYKSNDLHLSSLDTSARNKGMHPTNFVPSSLWTNMIDANIDMDGNVRGADGSWDRGAFEYVGGPYITNGLLCWLAFENDFTNSGIATDSSTNAATMLRFGWLADDPTTNWPDRVAGKVGAYSAYFLPNYTNTNIWSQTQYHDGDYGAITNVSSSLSSMTNATIMLWAKYDTSPNVGLGWDQGATFLASGYATNGAWTFGRDYDYKSSFIFCTNKLGGDFTFDSDFPDDFSATGASDDWHHYCVTLSCSNTTVGVSTFYDGTNYQRKVYTSPDATNNVDALHIYKLDSGSFRDVIYVGSWHHLGTPPLSDADEQPNVGWMHGWLDDIRIYNRVLTAGEIGAIYAGTEATYEEPAAPGATNMLQKVTLRGARVTTRGGVTFR